MNPFSGYIPDVVVHGIAGFLGSLSVVYLHAALTTSGYVESQRKVFRHLEQLAKTLPKELQVLVAKYMGYFGAFILIVVLAVAFGFLGKLIAPPLSSAFKYFGDQDAKLWVEQKRAIFAAEESLQLNAKLSTDEWMKLQNSMGRFPVQVVRALIPFTIVLVLAGIIDVVRASHRARGAALVVAGAIFFVLCVLMWSNFQGDYVRQLRVEYRKVVKDGLFPQ